MSSFNKSLCFFLVICKIIISLGSYYISTNPVKYNNTPCQMAVPGILPKLKKGEARLDIKEDIGQMDKGETLWIGYIKPDMAFQYIGCVKESDIPKSQNNPSTKCINGILSKCYESCQSSKSIGVTLEKCYCFDSSQDTWNKKLLHHNRCNDACENPNSVACGGSHKDNSYVSLYSRHTNEHGGDRNNVWYGYLKRKNGEYPLNFTDEKISMRVLCENKMTDTTTSRSGGNTAAIVSIIVILVIIAIVAVIIFVHRRWKYSRRFDKMKETETVTGYENNYPEFTNSSRSTTAVANTLDDAFYNYPDFTIQDASNAGRIGIGLNTNDACNRDNKTNKGRIAQSGPHVTEDCEYNDEETKRVYNKLDDDGSYNVLGTKQKLVPDKTYDHAAKVQKTGTSASDDITYDVSMSSGVLLKITRGGPTDNVYNTNNEIYNRFSNDKERLDGKTNNLYGTGQMDKYRHVLNPSSDQNDHTYNTSSENFGKCRVTNNPYSKLDT